MKQKTMTFEQARSELKKIAKGKYRALYYQFTEEGNRIVDVDCHAYIDPGISSESKPTWAETLRDMREKLNPKQKSKRLNAVEAPR